MNRPEVGGKLIHSDLPVESAILDPRGDKTFDGLNPPASHHSAVRRSGHLVDFEPHKFRVWFTADENVVRRHLFKDNYDVKRRYGNRTVSLGNLRYELLLVGVRVGPDRSVNLP